MAYGAVAWSQVPLPGETANQEFLRQQERERQLRQQQEQTPDVHLPSPPEDAAQNRLPAEESPCFSIEQIRLIGEASERFQWALAAAEKTAEGDTDPATNRCLGSRSINLVMKRVQNAILQRGYVTTRVLAAPQDLSTGTLALTLIPGRIRSIRFADDADPRATQWNALPASPGDLLNLRDIEQALENFERVPTAQADIQIVPAGDADGGTADAKPGESDLLIRWKQRFPFRLSVSTDNSGSKATGKYIGNVTLSYDHWLTLNDLFYVNYNQDLGGGDSGARGTRGATVHYSIPFGYWLLGITAGNSHYYQSVAGINQTYDYSGDSETADIRLSRLVYRDAVRKTTLSLRGWTRRSSNFIDDTEIKVQRRRTAGWEFGVNHREFIGQSVLDLNLAYRRGTGAMKALRAPEEAFGEGASRAEIITADAQLSLPFALGEQRLAYTGTWRAQWNRTPLVQQDRFSIGNRYTVRGFDEETLLSGDSGWILRNELGWSLGQSGQELYLGIDYGKVGGRSSKYLVGTDLAGAAAGLRGRFKWLAYDIFVGTPIKKPDHFETSNTVFGFNVSLML